jgi:6-phosphogluconolactonase
MSIGHEVRVYKTVQQCVRAAAEYIAGTVRAAVEKNGVCYLALSGGETPAPVYETLGSMPLSAEIDWTRVHLFFVDERSVPPDHPQSNYGMIQTRLLSRLSLSPGNIHRIHGETHPAVAAAEYRAELDAAFKEKPATFDLITLGLGEDGHTASLFPGTEAVLEGSVPVRAVFVPQLRSWRVTLTRACLDNARSVVFLVTGGAKAGIVRSVLQSVAPRPEIPATLVRPAGGSVLWLLDGAAASLLPEPPGYGFFPPGVDFWGFSADI